jgi:DNA-binding PadR family transcriptional regulator
MAGNSSKILNDDICRQALERLGYVNNNHDEGIFEITPEGRRALGLRVRRIRTPRPQPNRPLEEELNEIGASIATELTPVEITDEERRTNPFLYS